MNLRWLWFDHIPPELEVPKEARRIRRAHALLSRFNDPQRSKRLFFLALVLFLATVVPAVALVVWSPIAYLKRFPVDFGILLGACWLWMVLVQLVLRPDVRRGLCQLGYLCCVKCGYVHTGLSKDVKECPECGAAREFGKCIHCNSPQEWAMTPQDKCTQCGRLRLS